MAAKHLGGATSRSRSYDGHPFIEPELPTPARKPPIGAGWVHEIKFDGYRLLRNAKASAAAC
jgi:ATP-dependent DNA ligase